MKIKVILGTSMIYFCITPSRCATAWLRPKLRSKSGCSTSVIGFTLVELSIVIVIIGLVVAGVTAGQSLVRQAKLQRVTSESKSILLAIQGFKLQYNALPGDFNNAYAIWGANCAGSANDCNGTNNRHVEWNTPGKLCDNAQEPLLFWKHLQLAGLISGSYSGVCVSSGYANTNSYRSDYGTNTIYIAQHVAKDAISLSAGGDTDNLTDWNPALKPTDAKTIDSKIDDGLPNTGKVYSVEGTAPAGTCLLANAYTVTETVARCVIRWLLF